MFFRGQTVGKYRIISTLGSGGFGTVWKARDMQLDRLVAVKLPHRSRLGAEESELFFREARAAAQLRHPGIVSVYEVGRTEESIYIVSELIEGISLADWLKDGRLSAPNTDKRRSNHNDRKIKDRKMYCHLSVMNTFVSRR